MKTKKEVEKMKNLKEFYIKNYGVYIVGDLKRNGVRVGDSLRERWNRFVKNGNPDLLDILEGIEILMDLLQHTSWKEETKSQIRKQLLKDWCYYYREWIKHQQQSSIPAVDYFEEQFDYPQNEWEGD